MREEIKTIPKGWTSVLLGKVSKITNGNSNTQDAVIDGAYVFFDRSNTIKS